MVATFSSDPPSKTEQLSNWISRVRSKKIVRRRSPKRDLRVEAVLTNALFKAEFELRTKQRLRNIKWQELKKELKLDDYYCKRGDGTSYSEEYSNYLRCQDNNQEEEALCEELRSLNDFMSQLSDIKVPIER